MPGARSSSRARPGWRWRLTGVSAALLTVYDMCKALDKTMELTGIHLVHKEGGKSGVFHHG